MSYILEALKKAEQQREVGRVPGIGSVHEQVRGGARGRWLWAVGGVLTLNAAVLLVLFWPDQRREVSVDAAIASLPAQKAVSAAQVPAQQAVSVPQAVTAQQAAPPAAAQVEGQEMVRELPLQPSSPAQARHERPQPGGLASPVAVHDTEIPYRSQEPAAKPDKAPQLPVWPQVPAHLFEQLNRGLRLDVHVFASQPAERFVLINLKKYHQGQQLQEGPQLDEITAEGVILSFRGERFRLQAQQ